ncbi:hypothetical protein CYLTODRAFT_450158 [Cylindrobasidium torrendii FP15055 ss-10]|uniref:F-box domain-containing protein n=1 Tax=Cylindrobasidium torrendii FP15055 ss-10 TaxID=1314674 RepID=A0A0D7BP97_9AGAR|nr:hypothetical protein CYLTODRAFT_450158 [Cylindrobasidium torrendii FP15055 ss-10]
MYNHDTDMPRRRDTILIELPVELILYIFECTILAYPSAKSTIALVCRRARGSVESSVFRDIYLHNRASIRKFVDILRSNGHTTVGEYVRSICFPACYGRHDEGPSAADAAAVLKSCPFATSLAIPNPNTQVHDTLRNASAHLKFLSVYSPRHILLSFHSLPLNITHVALANATIHDECGWKALAKYFRGTHAFTHSVLLPMDGEEARLADGLRRILALFQDHPLVRLSWIIVVYPPCPDQAMRLCFDHVKAIKDPRLSIFVSYERYPAGLIPTESPFPVLEVPKSDTYWDAGWTDIWG